MENKNFVTFLVDETLRLQKSGEVKLSSFELKLNDYSLEFIKGEFIPQAQILRFVTPFGLLDVPVNWSVFSIEKPSADYSLLDSDHDHDYFFKVVKSAWKKPFEKMLITQADGFCYVVGLKLGEENHLHDLINPQIWLKAA
jgi:hypothetical protein